MKHFCLNDTAHRKSYTNSLTIALNGGLPILLRAGAKLMAFERDRRCLPALAELQEAFPGKLRIIEDDAMAVDAQALAGNGTHIISNLPYNVGTALLVGWLTEAQWRPWWASLTLMFQLDRKSTRLNSSH